MDLGCFLKLLLVHLESFPMMLTVACQFISIYRRLFYLFVDSSARYFIGELFFKQLFASPDLFDGLKLFRIRYGFRDNFRISIGHWNKNLKNSNNESTVVIRSVDMCGEREIKIRIGYPRWVHGPYIRFFFNYGITFDSRPSGFTYSHRVRRWNFRVIGVVPWRNFAETFNQHSHQLSHHDRRTCSRNNLWMKFFQSHPFLYFPLPLPC